IAQDGSAPMLQRARQIMASYSARFQPHQSDLFDKNWLPQQFGSFDAAVSVSCLHNLRDFKRISEIYSDICTHLKPGGVFLNLDLATAQRLGRQQHYARITTIHRQREGTSREDATAPLQQAHQTAAHDPAHASPANLDEQLAALRAAGFTDVDCFWKDLRRA